MIKNKEINKVFYSYYFLELFNDLVLDYENNGDNDLMAKLNLVRNLNEVASEIQSDLILSKRITFELDNEQITELNSIVNEVVKDISANL